VGLYYCIEIWWKRLFFPGVRYVAPPKLVHFADSLFCAAYGVAVAIAAGRFGWEGLWWGFFCPFLVWNWMMGATIFGHHTDPAVPWFDDKDEWQRAEPQIRCTVHLEFPWVVRVLLHQIFDHNAHHLDVTIPLYRLREAQMQMQQGCQSILVQRWSPATFARHLRTCKLYDFRLHQWQDYYGKPTSQIPVWFRQQEESSCMTSRTGSES
jgi:omega-6 fatty acid desaturase (delta-12 desaturase)